MARRTRIGPGRHRNQTERGFAPAARLRLDRDCHPDQPRHRLRQTAAAADRARPGRRECLHLGQPDPQYDHRARPRRGIDRDGRADFGAGRTGGRGRRRRLRPQAGHRRLRGTCRGHTLRRGGDAAAGDPGLRLLGRQGQYRTDHGVDLSIGARHPVLRHVGAVHGDSQYPAELQTRRLGTGAEQPRRAGRTRPLRPHTGRDHAGSGPDERSEIAGPRRRHHPRCGHPGADPAARDQAQSDRSASTVGYRRAPQAVRQDGLGHHPVRGDQPDRSDRLESHRVDR